MNRAKNKKRLLAIVILLLAFVLALPSAVFAIATGQPPSDAVGGAMSVEYKYAEGETPDIPQEISQFGFVYHLVSVSEPVLESTLPNTRTYTYRVGGSLTPEQLEQVRSMGGITLTPRYLVKEREVDKTATLTVPTNDVDDIPLTMAFTVTSGTAAGGTETKMLDRAAVKFTVNGPDKLGRPGGYTAVVTYRGTETYAKVDYYVADVTFQTTQDEGGTAIYVVVAGYETDLPEVVDEEETLTETLVRAPEAATPGPYDNQTGNIVYDLLHGYIPVGSFYTADARSLLSLIMAFVSVVGTVYLAVGLLRNKKTEEDIIREQYETGRPKRNRSWQLRIVGIFFGLLAFIICLLVDDPTLPMAWVNNHTFVVSLFFAAHLIFFSLFRTTKTLEDRDDLENDSGVASTGDPLGAVK